jgi:hypothetical protein
MWRALEQAFCIFLDNMSVGFHWFWILKIVKKSTLFVVKSIALRMASAFAVYMENIFDSLN